MMGILTLEDGTDMLSQNVGNKPTYAAQQTTRVKLSRKKILHQCALNSAMSAILTCQLVVNI
jgi:hypothetical protein